MDQVTSATEVMQLPLGFESWNAFLQGVTIALLTFVSEDLTTVGAAVLSWQSSLGLVTAYLGAFLGIWAGDAGLYWLARGVGGSLTERRWLSRLVSESKLAETRCWFATRGVYALVLCRFLPGTRLPTYLVAGFLRMGFGRFLVVTGVCAFVWTALIFAVVATVGVRVFDLLEKVGHVGWAAVGTIVLAYLFVRLGGRCCTAEGRQDLAARFGRLTRWEFWPAWLFYIPVVMNYAWLGLRFRGLMLPTVANPGMEAGGMIGESKFDTLADLESAAPEFTARSFLIGSDELDVRERVIEALIAEGKLSFPFILKPDHGQRGIGVKLVRVHSEILPCLKSNAAPLVAQEFVEGPHEIGVFYYRMPGEDTGHVFAITLKEFPSVIGDGERNLRQLIRTDERARFMKSVYEKRFSVRLDEVPGDGQQVPLVLAGNHAQGCVFRDGMHLLTAALASRIDVISRSIDGFYIGRYDLRYSDPTELANGRGFKIIELNGASAEATSIYDPKNSLANAYATLFRQWRLVFEIGAHNRESGHVPESAGQLLKRALAFRRMASGYPGAD